MNLSTQLFKYMLDLIKSFIVCSRAFADQNKIANFKDITTIESSWIFNRINRTAYYSFYLLFQSSNLSDTFHGARTCNQGNSTIEDNVILDEYSISMIITVFKENGLEAIIFEK